MSKICSFFCVFLIQSYQILISPWIGAHCRYTISCSNYTIKKIKKYQLYGIFLGFQRIITCHSWGKIKL